MVKRFLVLMLVLGVLLATGLFVVWMLTRTPPGWYAPPDPRAAATIELADTVEFRMLEELQKIRPEPEPWSLLVRDTQVNAWLAAKLQGWIAHREDLTWPEGVDLPQVRFESDSVSLALSMRALGSDTVVVTRLHPRFEDGKLFVDIDRYAVGQLSMPGESSDRIAALIDGYLQEAAAEDPDADMILKLLRGEQGIDPVLDLADDRRVRVTDIELQSGTLVMTARTLSSGDP